jgi:hypothetical protein
MMKLAEYQKKFIQEITGADLANPALRIYRNAAQIVRVKALQQIFPVCEKIVGPDYFTQLAQAFIEKNVSITIAINQQGGFFSSFIMTQPVQQQVPYLADLAQLEWLWHEVLHSPSNTLLGQQDPLAPHHLLQQVPHARLLHSDYPLIEIWHMCQDDYRGDFTIQSRGKSTVLIVQVNDELRLLPLAPIEERILVLLTTTMSCTNLQNKYKNVYNETLTLAVLEKSLTRKALLRIK